MRPPHERPWSAPPGHLTVEHKSVDGRDWWVVSDTVGVSEMATAFADLSPAAQHAYRTAHPDEHDPE
jgi:hypothetical protein